jgi:uncharacterized protein
MTGYTYEWDEAKRVANLERHGVDFLAIVRLDWSRQVVFEDRRRDYGEPRFLVYAPIDTRLYALVFTPRNDFRRVISLRKANRREQAAYEAGFHGRR